MTMKPPPISHEASTALVVMLFLKGLSSRNEQLATELVEAGYARRAAGRLQITERGIERAEYERSLWQANGAPAARIEPDALLPPRPVADGPRQCLSPRRTGGADRAALGGGASAERRGPADGAHDQGRSP